jgi:CRP/FNR family cyclic AMP-dependent transcriptional regulator
MSRLVETLAGVTAFRSLGAAAIQRLNSQCIWRRAAPKEWLSAYHEDKSDVLFVVKGAARVKLQAIPGREILLRDLAAGDFFGELSTTEKMFGLTGLVAVTEVIFARMPAAVFRSIVHNHPEVCEHVLAFMAEQVRGLLTRVREFTSLNARHRIYAELLRLSRPAAGCPSAALISPPPAHAEIAARVSIRREAVTRELKALERAGIVCRRVVRWCWPTRRGCGGWSKRRGRWIEVSRNDNRRPTSRTSSVASPACAAAAR